MQLSDFNTLADAKAYFEVNYSLITSGLASQYFGLTGMRQTIEDNYTNTTSITVDPGFPPTTVGQLCKTIMNSLNGIGFATNPNKQDGALNRACGDILVAQNLFSQELIDGFFALGESKTFPFANETEHTFMVANGTIPVVPATLSVLGDNVIINTTASCEKHNPRVTTSDGKRITSFYNVALPGYYVTKVPNEYFGQALFVDDAYGVMV